MLREVWGFLGVFVCFICSLVNWNSIDIFYTPFYVLEDLNSVFKFLMCSIWSNTVAKGTIHGKNVIFVWFGSVKDTFNVYT